MRLLVSERDVPSLASGSPVRQLDDRLLRRLHVPLGRPILRNVEALFGGNHAQVGSHRIRPPGGAPKTPISRSTRSRHFEKGLKININKNSGLGLSLRDF